MSASTLKVAVWAHHGLGDVIMALPMLISIDQNLSAGSSLLILVKSKTEIQLLKTIRWQSNIKIFCMDYSGKWELLSVLRLALFVRRWCPDIFLAPHAANSLAAVVFSRIVNPRLNSVGPDGRWSWIGFSSTVPYLSSKLHKAEYYSIFAEKAELYSNLIKDIPYQSSEFIDKSLDKLIFIKDDINPFIIISPGSSSLETHKRWLPDKYTKLINQLNQNQPDLRILLMGSGAEKDLLEDIFLGVNYAAQELCIVLTPTNLADALTIISQADCVVCGCTGAGHMAAMTGTPVIGIYGPTNYSFTGPYTSQLRVVRMGYRCSPCYRPGFVTGCGTPRCMNDIDVQPVLDAVLKTLSNEPYFPLALIETTDAECFEV